MDTAFLKDATLVFDLDGTLVDTAPDLLRALNHVLSSVNCEPRRLEQVRPYISYGARRMIVEGLSAAGRSPANSDVDVLLAAFLDYYAENLSVESRLYPGVIEAVDWARDAGAILAVCTNKVEHLSKRLLRELKIDARFNAIAGRDTFPVCKPDPAHLAGAVDLAGGSLERAIMIGDSATDIDTAKAAGIPSVVVSFGYTSIPAAQLGADEVISHYAALPPALEKLMAYN